MLSQNSTIKYYILIITLSIVTLNSYAIYYQPQLETSFKVGKNRDIGRSSILIPLWQKEGQLLYFNAIGMMDNKNNQEGNFALGYRHKLDNNILGGYGYYDRKSSPNNNIFHQITIGLELLRENCECRINGYIPINNKRILKETPKETLLRQIGGQFVIREFNNQFFEKELGGFDIEGGVTIPKLPINLYLGYYYFDAKGVSTVQGPRLRGEIKLTDWLNITGEVQHDKPRGFNYFVGIELKANLGKKQDKLSILDRKMTQKPVRDIDIVVLEGEELKEYKDDIDDNGKPIIIIDSVKKLKELSETMDDELLSRTYVLTVDINGRTESLKVIEAFYKEVERKEFRLLNTDSMAWEFQALLQKRTSILPIGDYKHPFTGKFYGGYLDEQGNMHHHKISTTVTSQYLDDYVTEASPREKSVKYNALFGYTKNAVISHLELKLNFSQFDEFAPPERDGGFFCFGRNVLVTDQGNTSLVDRAEDTKIYNIVNNSQLLLGCIGHNPGKRGGLIRKTSGNTEIHNCVNNGDIDTDKGVDMGMRYDLDQWNYERIKAEGSFGGLVGKNMGKLTIVNSCNFGKIGAMSSAGGLVGTNTGTLTIHKSYNVGLVYAQMKTGGLVGVNKKQLIVSNSYNSGDIKTKDFAGGVVGLSTKGSGTIIFHSYNSGDVQAEIGGGLVGKAKQPKQIQILNSFNSGIVSGTNRSGELIGLLSVPGISKSTISQGFEKASPISNNLIKEDKVNVNVSSTDVIGEEEELNNDLQQVLHKQNHPMEKDFATGKYFINEEGLSKKLEWTFGADKTWMMTQNGPKLSWAWRTQEGREDVLSMLLELNRARLVERADEKAYEAIKLEDETKWPFIAEKEPYPTDKNYIAKWPVSSSELPKDIKRLIAREYQKHGVLSDNQVDRIIDFHERSLDALVKLQGAGGIIVSKKDMTKEQFLSHVYDGSQEIPSVSENVPVKRRSDNSSEDEYHGDYKKPKRKESKEEDMTL